MRLNVDACCNNCGRRYIADQGDFVTNATVVVAPNKWVRDATVTLVIVDAYGDIC